MMASLSFNHYFHFAETISNLQFSSDALSLLIFVEYIIELKKYATYLLRQTGIDLLSKIYSDDIDPTGHEYLDQVQ